MKFVPELDKNFKPAIIAVTEFLDGVKASKQANKLSIALERNNGYTYVYETEVYADGIGKDDENIDYVERLIKSMLWIVGGFKIFLKGSKSIFEKIKAIYSVGGAREFDVKFMERVYDQTFEVVNCEGKDFPKQNEPSLPVGGNNDGCRIGFDAGGSDRKVSAVIDGQVVYSEECIWHPKINTDPQYHYDGILDSMKRAASHMPRVDAIGVSSAGIYVDNQIKVASLFVKVNDEDFAKTVKNMYINIAKNEFNNVPLEVANDGDVTALAGGIQLNDGRVLGIAMGTSEAVGYIDKKRNLKGWLNELAFVPVDFNKNAMVDEWSGDYGVGCKYFSQDAVIKLAPAAGIDLDPSLTPAEKLKFVQDLNAQGDERANKIFESIGIYLGYAIAYYAMFYDIKHLLILGRVTSGKGGDAIMDGARKVLENQPEFKKLSKINITSPDEHNKRVGQSIACASLPKIVK